MGKITGFKEYKRQTGKLLSPEERKKNFKEFLIPLPDDKLQEQAARCMNCGIPFCHSGCPLGNIIPDFNDLVYRDDWDEALRRLHSTNNFPEITGRVCPAPCEEACTLGITDPPVTIKQIEYTIIEHAFREGKVKPAPPSKRTGKKVAVVGSGPAGLAAAMQLNRAGHTVTVFERADRIGGLLCYGIPDFKLDKNILKRRLKLMEEEGVIFKTGINVGVNYPVRSLLEFDAVLLCCGSTRPRDLKIPGRDLNGIHFAMEFLTQQNMKVQGDDIKEKGLKEISAKDKRVIVIGGGDTGSDCVGTANRQGAKSVIQFELLPKPPETRPPHQPWPYWPMKMRTSTSHEEGCKRYWSISTKKFTSDDNNNVNKLLTVDVEFISRGINTPPELREIPGTQREWEADLVLLALGFLGPETDGLVKSLGLELDKRGNIKTDNNYMTNVNGIFSAGDMRRGQSLVVWAISEGREAARCVDIYLMGDTSLPTKGTGDLPRR